MHFLQSLFPRGFGELLLQLQLDVGLLLKSFVHGPLGICVITSLLFVTPEYFLGLEVILLFCHPIPAFIAVLGFEVK